MIDLRALVSSPHWRWLPGMLAFVPTLEPGETDPAKWIACKVGRTNGRDPRIAWGAECFPNLDDEITMTLLLILARAAHHTLASTEYVSDGDPEQPWRFLSFRGRTEGEVLAAAILAAP